ncbi:restriction endonuclease subunit S [Herbaspirillum sp. RV1423]|uniref:restriction endonuclease subunit S n=1 Tax=Herbaspirillum sp. RV1423 TaxID=1443993 RepID=UPI0004B10FC6|nr:restriction endonuclease subunit S [Herbaspirillum sp. RV1423]
MKTLKQLADVQAGYPFRGSVPVVEGGNARALQMRDLTPEGISDWQAMAQTQIDAGRNEQLLRAGDIVFVARGVRNYAVCLPEVPLDAVCCQYFFLIRLNTDRLLPEFLAWQINRAPAQRYLASNAEGSDQLSIRRGVLEGMPIAVPPLPQQHAIIALAGDAIAEKRHLEALIHNRQQQQDAIARHLHQS